MADGIQSRRRNLLVSLELLRDALKLPDTVEIVEVRSDSQRDVSILTITYPEFSPLEEGQVTPGVKAIFSSAELPDGSSAPVFDGFMFVSFEPDEG